MNKTFYTYITQTLTDLFSTQVEPDDLLQRITEHYLNRGKPETFAGRYYCYNLLYYEETPYVLNSIDRENQLKGWRRSKKEALINETNPDWRFLNSELMEWPPIDPFHRGDFYKD